MKPGRDLDSLVAEKVMGYSHDPNESIYRYWYDSEGSQADLPNYSTDIAAAWEVVEKLLLTVDEFKVCKHITEGKWKWCSYIGNGHTIFADTAPHAICLAALKALGVDIPTT